MIFDEKKITLKDGRTAILKSPCVEDAEKMLNYIKKSCGETDFLARYPEEWNISVEQEEAWVNRLRSAPDTLGITCYIDGEVAGNCEISFRGEHRAGLRAGSHRGLHHRRRLRQRRRGQDQRHSRGRAGVRNPQNRSSVHGRRIELYLHRAGPGDYRGRRARPSQISGEKVI